MIEGLLRPAPVLVDLFSGGCAVTHAALLSGRFGRVIANDIDPMPGTLFRDAILGRINGRTRWISREEFFRLKATDPFVRYIWSYGSNGRDYLYSREKEPAMEILHRAIVSGDFSRLGPLREVAAEAAEGITELHARRVAVCAALSRAARSRHDCRALERVQALEHVQALERVRALELPGRLEQMCLDYREVPLPEGCTVYCDPPYAGTDGYGLKADRFDSAAFWEWARSCRHPLYVSEYNAPEDFVCVAEFPFQSLIGNSRPKSVVERVFVHRTKTETR